MKVFYVNSAGSVGYRHSESVLTVRKRKEKVLAEENAFTVELKGNISGGSAEGVKDRVLQKAPSIVFFSAHRLV
jgi:hypothetical protein